jgi:hypothetical protein
LPAGDFGVWRPSRGVPAWLLSLGLHFTTFTVLSLVVTVQPRGIAGVEPGRNAGIVLVHRSAQKTEYLSDEDAGGSLTSASAATSAAASPLPDAALPPPTDGPQLPTGTGAVVAALPASDAAPSTAGMTGSGSGLGRRGTGKSYDVETQVFGVKGRGSRFVYVFDRSASMAGYEGRPIAAAKRELIASLQSLGKVHQFQIIFYNERPHLMPAGGGAGAQMIFGNEQGKRVAEEFVRGVVPDGGTAHLEALKLALQMNPDVIFFLTDADEPRMTSSELAQVARWNRGTTINAIEFGSGPATGRDNFLRRIAEQSGGQHRYVDVTKLPRG